MKTIKELRAQDAERIARRNNPNPTPEEIETAKKIMRQFYYFASLYSNNFYINQDRNAKPEEIEESDKKLNKAYKKACENLKKYDLYIALPGLYPIIEEKNGAHFTMCHYYK